MTNARSFLREIGNEQWIPDDFGCSNISLWTNYGIQPVLVRSGEVVWYYSFVVFENIGKSYDVCTKVRRWKESLQLSCDALFCDFNGTTDLVTFIERETNFSTTIYDWINYCQYCTNDRTLRSYKQQNSYSPSNLKTCISKDEKDMYQAKENTQRSDDIKCGIKRVCTNFAGIFEVAYATSTTSTVIGNMGIAMVFASLFTWVLRWVSLVLLIKTKRTRMVIILYSLLAILFILVGIALPIVMTILGDLKSIVHFFSYYSAAMSAGTVFLFVISSAWIYWAMKQISDVDIFNSSVSNCFRCDSIIYFLAISNSLIVFEICRVVCRVLFPIFFLLYGYIDSTRWFFNGLIAGVINIAIHSSLVAISNGLTYSEFDKEDFYECLNYLICRKAKHEKGQIESTPMSANSDPNSSYYSQLLTSEHEK
ncbi:hypothetical protein FDP41_010180 [Naegleria fowleri]|uniref:Uncharacterized protein n=1 Tax=Naegleria fowleri TaxID=5763 RepID=A0A6A5BBJ1_NAEFO|nr:uncharacterized protein FDP41_010180 [Naegleria fowleri]KAF0971574.1 hypothetical protein FDP41_010180 [Naegleria fowleri]